ncbi:hypothetical protein ACLOJK_015202 [Asimina triloba]
MGEKRGVGFNGGLPNNAIMAGEDGLPELPLLPDLCCCRLKELDFSGPLAVRNQTHALLDFSDGMGCERCYRDGEDKLSNDAAMATVILEGEVAAGSLLIAYILVWSRRIRDQLFFVDLLDDLDRSNVAYRQWIIAKFGDDVVTTTPLIIVVLLAGFDHPIRRSLEDSLADSHGRLPWEDDRSS